MRSGILNLFLIVLLYINLIEANDDNPAIYSVETEYFSDAFNDPGGCLTNVTECLPQISCPDHVRMSVKPKLCALPSQTYGYCCPLKNSNRIKRQIGFEIDDSILTEAKSRLDTLLSGEFNSNGLNTPDFHHHSVFFSTKDDIAGNSKLTKSAMEEILIAQILKDREHISVSDFQQNNVDAEFTSASTHCAEKVAHCPNLNDKYRTADGSCNNPKKTLWGSKGQPMRRLLAPAYEDGIWEPRMHSSVDGSRLEHAREISRILLPDIHRPHPYLNIMLMQFGQFLAHDITQSSSITNPNGDQIQCCTEDGREFLPPHKRHFGCMPIHIEPHDEFYRKYRQGCMNFVRLSLSPNPECKISYGRQISKVSHYMDASTIYGSDKATSNKLRTFHGGKLRMFHNNGRDLLPLSIDKEDCSSISPANTCFKAGDGRSNQIISLTLLHTIFAREHNRLVGILSHLNPHFSDETLYQEARKIVIATLQHIVYNEYLPLILGNSVMKRFGLMAKDKGYSYNYDAGVNVAVSNEFTGAAYRFGHSAVDGKFIVKENNHHTTEIPIPDVMFNTNRLTERSFLDNFIRTMVTQPMQQIENSITFGLTRFLFKDDHKFGLDLAALNIHRGRDHAYRSYNDYLELIGHQKIRSFKEFHPELGNKLRMVYKHPDDIDLWIGGILEPHIGDAAVGPTFAEIIAEQFARLRNGDRYFYDSGPETNPGYFPAEQLHEIRKITLARVLCDNLDYYTINSIPPNAFLRSDLNHNSPVSCNSNSIPSINFNAWIHKP